MSMEPREQTAVVNCATAPADPWLGRWTDSGRDALSVFRIRLTDRAEYEAYLRSWLQPDERARAERYRRDEDRRRFTSARGLLRLLAGTYTNQLPGAVRFRAGVNRKPELMDAVGWHFNVSHSGDWILIAFAKTAVGVDVEQLQPDIALNDLLPASFSLPEQTYLAAQADVCRSFYHLWTRKEALVKATAKGIDEDFHRIPCLDGTHQPPTRLLGQGGHWAVWSFAAADAYPAAVACQLPGLPDGALENPVPVPQFYALDVGSLIARP